MVSGVCVLALLMVVPQILARAQQPHLQGHLSDSVRMLEQGDLTGAEGEARLAIANASSRALAYAILGAIRLQQSRYAESAGFLERAVRLDPRLVGAQLNLGNVYMLEGKRDTAATRFREVLKLDPKNFNARFALARIANEAGRTAESKELAKPIAQELRVSDEGLVLMASNALARNDRSQASALIPDWYALEHPSLAASLSFAQVFADHELLQQAISILEHDRSQSGGSFDGDFRLGTYYSKVNEQTKAAASYKLALDARPECAGCLYQMARIAEQQGSLDEALGYLLAARQMAPKDADIQFEFGRICVRKDLYKDAIESLTAAARLRPDNVSFQYVLASAYTGRKEYKQAIPILEHLLAAKPNDALLNYSLGAVQYLNGDLNDAASHLERSIQADPSQVAAYYYLGLTEEHEGKTEQAAQTLQTLAGRYPDHAPTFQVLGEIMLGQGKYPEARAALERATQLDASSVKSHYQLGLVLARMGQPEASKKEFDLVKNMNAEAEKQTEMEIFTQPTGLLPSPVR